MIDMKDLKAGDIFVVYHNQEPYHAAIYAPDPNEIGDIVHTCSGFYNSGVRRGTLTGMYHLHQNLNKAGNLWNFTKPRHTLTVKVYRHATLGETIAQQAKFWMLQGVRYDERRLLETIEYENNHPEDDTEADEQATIFEYLKYTARRETSPIKQPYFPNHAASFFAGFGSFTMAPSLNLPSAMVRGGKELIRSGTEATHRAKGFSCAGFVLACIGAALLRDRIGVVSEKSGWVSLKYGRKPKQESPYNPPSKERPEGKNHTRPGLDILLSEKQKSEFNLDKLRSDLGFLSKLHPHHLRLTSLADAFEKMTDEERSAPWQKLGELKPMPLTEHVEGRSKRFNKKEYRQEKSKDIQQILINHQRFCKEFGHTAFNYDNQPSFSQRFMTLFTGEKYSIMDYSEFRYHKANYGCLSDEEIKMQFIHQIRMQAELYLRNHWFLSLLVLKLGLGFMVKYVAETLHEKITHYHDVLTYLSDPEHIKQVDLNKIEDNSGVDEFYQRIPCFTPNANGN